MDLVSPGSQSNILALPVSCGLEVSAPDHCQKPTSLCSEERKFFSKRNGFYLLPLCHLLLSLLSDLDCFLSLDFFSLWKFLVGVGVSFSVPNTWAEQTLEDGAVCWRMHTHAQSTIGILTYRTTHHAETWGGACVNRQTHVSLWPFPNHSYQFLGHFLSQLVPNNIWVFTDIHRASQVM